MNRTKTNVWARIVALALVATISLVGGMAGMSALMSPSSATGAGLRGAWQERTGMADTPSARRSASTIAANPMSVLPQAYLPFVANPIDAVLVPAGNGVAAFRIGRTEVTNAQYRACVEAGACTEPSDFWDRCHYTNSAYAAHPVVCVTREQARGYAAWVGGALPTEAQWLRACQGDDGRTYPWGEAAPNETLANFLNYDTTPVGSYPAGASPYGALDMVGNVFEWVDDGNHVVRGGAFGNSAEFVVCDVRAEIPLDSFWLTEFIVGFRVVSPGP
jgi:formylglycine-generating enzyme required for sulfatase activity